MSLSLESIFEIVMRFDDRWLQETLSSLVDSKRIHGKVVKLNFLKFSP